MGTKEYVITQRTLTYLLTRRGVDILLCHHPRCRGPIVAGDRVVSAPGGTAKVHIYHKHCYSRTQF